MLNSSFAHYALRTDAHASFRNSTYKYKLSIKNTTVNMSIISALYDIESLWQTWSSGHRYNGAVTVAVSLIVCSCTCLLTDNMETSVVGLTEKWIVGTFCAEASFLWVDAQRQSSIRLEGGGDDVYPTNHRTIHPINLTGYSSPYPYANANTCLKKVFEIKAVTNFLNFLLL